MLLFICISRSSGQEDVLIKVWVYAPHSLSVIIYALVINLAMLSMQHNVKKSYLSP